MDKIKNINNQTDHSQVKETEKKKKDILLEEVEKKHLFLKRRSYEMGPE